MNRSDPCTVRIVPDTDGGIEVVVSVPTYDGTAELSLRVERSNGGDWHAFIPWPDGLGDEVFSINDGWGDACGGIVYLGAPEETA